MKIKVCGLTNTENAVAVVALPINYYGMIFYPKSPRNVDRNSAIRVSKAVKPNRNGVGVFVNAPIDKILSAIADIALTTIQLHGDESPEQCQELKLSGLTVIKAFRINDSFNFETVNRYEPYCNYFLLDTAGKIQGGTGSKFDWEILNKYTGKVPFFLSGGIGPEDAHALKQIRHPGFYGIDLNSRFETAPGIKDIALLKQFINELHEDGQ